MGKPISDITIWNLLSINPYALGTNKVNIPGLANIAASAFTNFPRNDTHSAVDPNGFNANDSLFLKRYRYNSMFKLFENINLLGGPLYLSCPDTSLAPPVTQQFESATLAGMYEWQDVNMFIPIEQGANKVVRPVLYMPASFAWYTAPAIYTSETDVLFLEIEWVHNLPLVLP
jgi:hypothetical protein